MRKLLIVLAFAALPIAGFAQATSVKITARGIDVRPIIHDLFDQVKKNYVLDPNVQVQLYMSLHDVEFDEALELICKTAGLTYEVQNGIYFIKADPKRPAAKPAEKPAEKPKVQATPIEKPIAKPIVPTAEPKPKLVFNNKPRTTEDPLMVVPPVNGKPVVKQPEAPKATLDKSVLNKRITTRLKKVDFRALINELERQTGLKIEVDEAVPHFQLDAVLRRTSLKYTLDWIAKAARLNYVFTDRNSILIQSAPAPKGS